MKERQKEYLKIITIAREFRLWSIFYIIIFLYFKNFQKHNN